MQKLNNFDGNKKLIKLKKINLGKKAAVYAVSLYFCICVAAGVVSAGVFSAQSAAYTVVIDAGHGGIDGGVTGINTGVKESDINLKMAKILKSRFEKAGVTAVMTRETADGLYSPPTGSFKLKDFEKRRDIILAASPEIVVSLHANFFRRSPARRGAQVFYYSNSLQSRALASAIQNNINENINMKYSGRMFSKLAGDYYILNCSPYPSVIVECGFLSNAEDEKLLITESYRAELCAEIFAACMNYLYTNND